MSRHHMEALDHARQRIDGDALDHLLDRALAEDLGETGRDVTGELLIALDQRAMGRFVSRASGRLCGGFLLPNLAQRVDAQLQTTLRHHDGDALAEGSEIATIEGPLRSMLMLERTALNFLTHLSGIATTTAAFVDAVQDTNAKICDTRKTIPGWRDLAKYAVACGGGINHRIGLFDAVLVKDNHIAHLKLNELADALTEVIRKARSLSPAPSFVEIEVDTLDQLRQLLDLANDARPDIILLDNMTCEQMLEAVSLRNKLAPTVQLEASGGVNLQTVRAIGRTGVDRIAIGALTHSAPALDIGLDIA